MPHGNKQSQKKNKSGKGFEYDEEGAGGLVPCTVTTEGFFVWRPEVCEGERYMTT